MTKRSGRDRRVSVYFPPPEGERRAYQDRRAESVSEEIVEPSKETRDPREIEKGPIARSRNVAIVVLILAAVLVVLL